MKWTLVGTIQEHYGCSQKCFVFGQVDLAHLIIARADEQFRSMSRDIKTDTTALRIDTVELKQDTAQILEEIANLQARRPQGATGTVYLPYKYLHNMTTYP